MKKSYCIAILCLMAFLVVSQRSSAQICPVPASMQLDKSEYYPISRLSIACPDEGAVKWAKDHLKQWFINSAPEVVPSAYDGGAREEGAYRLQIGPSEISVSAGTLQGVRYALYSLRQLAMPARGTLQVQGWIAPKAVIDDKPALKFRGIHLCWFHETEPWVIERQIRLAAYYKLNYVVLEPWGTFKSKVAPWYCWDDAPMDAKEIKRLRKIAEDLGVTLIPQLNIFGHATQSRGGTGKHAALDRHPEYQAIFEPDGGWNFCLSNPQTRKLVIALAEELHEAFGNPPYFHIGCDEANAPTCPDCLAQPYSKLLLDHISAVADVLGQRGAKVMMWHDMFLERGDPRWKGFYDNGSAETAKAALSLPKNSVICDWYYGGKQEDYPTLKYFKELGYEVLSCPWHEVSGIMAQSAYVQKNGMDGVLGTLWHHNYGKDMQNVFEVLSNSVWNAKPGQRARINFFTHLRQVTWDMNLKKHEGFGIYNEEVPSTTFQSWNYPD